MHKVGKVPLKSHSLPAPGAVAQRRFTTQVWPGIELLVKSENPWKLVCALGNRVSLWRNPTTNGVREGAVGAGNENAEQHLRGTKT